MAQTQVPAGTPTGLTSFSDTAMGATVDAVKASSAVVYSVIIDNSQNIGAACYVKIFNLAAGSVILGTTAPDEIIYVPAGKVITHFMFTGSVPGKTFANALSAACVTAGGTAGTNPPANPVDVTINYV